jgi:hypothetical protein
MAPGLRGVAPRDHRETSKPQQVLGGRFAFNPSADLAILAIWQMRKIQQQWPWGGSVG